jgi:hypothetical protein
MSLDEKEGIGRSGSFLRPLFYFVSLFQEQKGMRNSTRFEHNLDRRYRRRRRRRNKLLRQLVLMVNKNVCMIKKRHTRL